VPVQADPELATETLKSSAATPAAVALLDAASAEQKSGNLSSAASNLERAQRIEPHNALVWYRLAVVRFRQGDLQQAEQLALKSDSLASSDSGLRARSWRLVALARERRGDAAGAAEAKRRVESLEP
jgi:Flp pilus assembly protein TadD